MSDVTIGEAYARRRLHKTVIGISDVYKPGQYAASKLGADDAMLTWVGADGAVCIVACNRNEEGEWHHRGAMMRGTFLFITFRPLPRSFALTTEMNRALEKAAPRQGSDPDATPPVPES